MECFRSGGTDSSWVVRHMLRQESPGQRVLSEGTVERRRQETEAANLPESDPVFDNNARVLTFYNGRNIYQT